MLLQAVMDYCREKKWVDLVAIAKHFGRERSAMEGMLSILERKLLLRPLSGDCGAVKCRNCTLKCGTNRPSTKLYVWCDS